MPSTGIIVLIVIIIIIVLAGLGIGLYFIFRNRDDNALDLQPIPGPPIVSNPQLGSTYSIRSALNREYYIGAYRNTGDMNMENCAFSGNMFADPIECRNTSWTYATEGIRTSDGLYIGKEGDGVCEVFVGNTLEAQGSPILPSNGTGGSTPIAWRYDITTKTLCLPPGASGNTCSVNEPETPYLCLGIDSQANNLNNPFISTVSDCIENPAGLGNELVDFQWEFTQELSSSTEPKCLDM